ncbi:hypothetical protein GCM10027199_83990 [Amycolatopsis magusensis]
MVSASGTWNTPYPSCGMTTPLFRVTVGMPVMKPFLSLFFPQWTVTRPGDRCRSSIPENSATSSPEAASRAPIQLGAV